MKAGLNARPHFLLKKKLLQYFNYFKAVSSSGIFYNFHLG